jgi:hypothetical protein
MKNFTEDKALWELRDKGVEKKGNLLIVESGSVGIRSLAKIDFLVNHKEYSVRFLKSPNR